MRRTGFKRVVCRRLSCWVVLFCCLCVSLVFAKDDPQYRATPPTQWSTWQDFKSSEQAPPLTWQAQGHYDFTYWGLSVYKASLWWGTPPKGSSQPMMLNSSPLAAWGLPQGVWALSLIYQRSFSTELLVKRSMQEMTAQHALSEAQREGWEKELKRVLPNVNAQDELVAIFDHHDLARVFVLGKAKGGSAYEVLGELSEPQLALSFMGIWLSPQTSQPKMRQALMTTQGQDKLEARD